MLLSCSISSVRSAASFATRPDGSAISLVDRASSHIGLIALGLLSAVIFNALEDAARHSAVWMHKGYLILPCYVSLIRRNSPCVKGDPVADMHVTLHARPDAKGKRKRNRGGGGISMLPFFFHNCSRHHHCRNGCLSRLLSHI